MSRFNRIRPGVYSMGEAAGSRLVFLHGWLGSSADWVDVVSFLSTSCRCTVLDLPGHGDHREDGAGTGSLDEAVDWLHQRLNEVFGEEPTVLVGYSLGGRLAVELAIQSAGSVKGLVLMSSRPGMAEENRADRQKSDKAWCSKIRTDWQGFLQEWYTQPMFYNRQKPSEELQKLILLRGTAHPIRAAETLENWSPALQQDRLAWLIHSPVPLLYLAGSQDKKYADLADHLRRKSPSCRVEILEDTGHAVHLDRPQLCADAIKRFIENKREFLCP